MAATFPERRLHPRVDIDGEMSYEIPGSNEIGKGRLENLSQGGARIWVGEELPAASEVIFRMAGDSPNEAGLVFRVTVLHMLPRQQDSLYGYGCRIETSSDWPPERN